MCYDDNARPPLPPSEAGAAHGEDIVLEAADGNRFAAYAAQPGKPTGAQILIFPDVRGLHQFYKELALRFAEIGITAVAIDYFGRTAETFFADVAAALAYLRSGEGAHRSSFTVGFCMGGTLSFLSGTQDFGFAGVIGFYAGVTRDFGGRGTLLEQAHKIRYPVLGLFGGADPNIPISAVQRFDEVLDEAGVEHEMVIYPGAPHSFFDRRAVEFADVSADAWQHVLSFIAAHT